jgi:myo-inositol-1(or 4)-monophosphatase
MIFSISHAMEIAVDASKMAGQILREMLESASSRMKAPKDLVTDADLAAQAAIEKRILSEFPAHFFLGEESATTQESWDVFSREEFCWVVDPLDGTVNYVHRLPSFAVSIALMQNNRCVLGVVLDPMSGELFTAVEGKGAHLNGMPIRASSVSCLEEAMVAVSFPPQVHRESVEIQQFIEVLLASQSVRRLGSAALNLCYVASGRLDAYWANSLKPWDVAAGALIAREANAKLTDLAGHPFDVWNGEVLAASTSSLWQELQCTLKNASEGKQCN